MSLVFATFDQLTAARACLAEWGEASLAEDEEQRLLLAVATHPARDGQTVEIARVLGWDHEKVRETARGLARLRLVEVHQRTADRQSEMYLMLPNGAEDRLQRIVGE